MAAWWSGSVPAFLAADPASVVERLAFEATSRFRLHEAQQLRAWEAEILLLRDALALADTDTRVLLEFEIPRLSGRVDAVLVMPRGVVVLEFKVGAAGFDNAARRQVEDYALDLQDFHAGSRRHPIVPVLVATEARTTRATLPLLLGGASAVQDAGGSELGGFVHDLALALPSTPTPIDTAAWEHAPYRPVPGIVDAACMLFARHDVADIASARADASNLTLTTDAINNLVGRTEQDGSKIVVFVTGIPGAGKTLCGLNAAFSREKEAAFLTGNPTLVHVLREALVRDAVHAGRQRQAASQQMEGVIQALPRFRDEYVRTGHVPPERIVVIDEAQRAWTAAQAIAKTRTRPVQLDRSEPAHLLDIMARHVGFAAIVCLVGNGQEIHDGEGGLATWGEALVERPSWRVACAPSCLDDPEPRSRLPRLAAITTEPSLHLTVPIRSLRHDDAPSWVDAVLRGDDATARGIAEGGGLPFHLTRDVGVLRSTLRDRARGIHRAGLVASSGARRLRAEGLGAELPHMEADSVARWFLDSWVRDRDVRASDALEVVATQFSVQGLELDHVGLCWDADLIRPADPSVAGWEVRRFQGTRWQRTRDANKIAYRLNTYRVLLTRARYGTVIWVPRGDAADPTRSPAIYDAVAGYLEGCGIRAPSAEPVAARGRDEAPSLLTLMQA